MPARMPFQFGCRVGLSAIAICTTVMGLAGCGSSGPFDYVKVEGKFVYEDGSPIPLNGESRVVFKSEAAPIDEIYHARPAVAYVGADGTFTSVTSHKYGDGLVPGKHKVILSAVDAEGKPLIPREYSDPNTTPLELDTADSPLVLKIRKPTAEERQAAQPPQSEY